MSKLEKNMKGVNKDRKFRVQCTIIIVLLFDDSEHMKYKFGCKNVADYST